MVLRHFRDNVLLKTGPGTAFVELYYRYSPPIADFIRKHEILRVVTRWLLTPLIFSVKYAKFTGSVAMIFLIGSCLSMRRNRTKLQIESD